MAILKLLVIFYLSLAAPLNMVKAESSVVDSSVVKFDVVKYTLNNGLTVLLLEDHSAPLVSYHTWFRVGSKDEEKDYTGIAHLFEHMMFKGAKRYDSDAFEKLLSSKGAQYNAFTTRDYTGYYINIPSQHLDMVMDIESDRMVNLQINESNLKSEREVVKEERRYRVENQPVGKLFEAIFSTVYTSHPYRWPVIGWMKDLNNINVSKCKEFYDTYYAPNNAVLVIAGDINIKKTKRLIESYYGKIKKRDLTKAIRHQEPLQTKPRSKKVKANLESEYLALVYPVSEVGSRDGYALDLLAATLGEGSSSRLYKRLVYELGIATRVSVNNIGMKDNGLFVVIVEMKPGVSSSRAIKVWNEELKKVKQNTIGIKEFEKTQNQIMNDHVHNIKTISGKARALALYEVMLGSYEHLFKDLSIYRQVTPQEIKQVANKYLVPTRLNKVIVQ